jgi:DNA-binding NarL/FixJ family response regulator
MRDALGQEVFARAWRSGAVLPIEQAISTATEFLDRLLVPDTPPERAPIAHGLTARELDVLCLLTQGKSDREIAETLFIGTRTVETHVSNLLGKLGAQNRAEAAALAVREQIV